MAGTLKKSQSAMEYLMTYGWAILIIAVVLGVMFALGVFNSSNFTSTVCTGEPGFLCQGLTFYSDGTVSFTFGQATANTRIYDLEMACTSSINQTGNAEAANNINPYQVILANGLAITQDPTNVLLTTAVVQDSRLFVTGLHCYDKNGILMSNVPLTSSFSGWIWVNYSLPGPNGQAPPAPAPNPIYDKAASITAKVT